MIDTSEGDHSHHSQEEEQDNYSHSQPSINNSDGASLSASHGEERSLTLQVMGDGRITSSNIPSLTCAFLAALTTGGTTYAFGLYGAALKHTLHLTQSQLDTIGSATFCAGLFSWVPGMVVDKWGTKTGLVAGGIQGSVSLCLYWCVATQLFPVERVMLVPTLSMLGVFIFLSCALITGSVFKIIVSTCGPGSKGTAVGAAKGYVGLGAGVYACMFDSIRSKGQSDLDFLPMAAFFFFACVTVPSFCLMPSNKTVQQTIFNDDSTPLHFRSLYASLACMASLIIVNSLRELYSDDGEAGSAANEDKHDGPNVPMVLFLFTIWVGPIASLKLLPKKSSLEEPAVDEIEGESLLHEEGETEIIRGDGEIEISRQRMSRKSNSSVGSNGSVSRGLSPMVAASRGVHEETVPDFLRLPDGTDEHNNFHHTMENMSLDHQEDTDESEAKLENKNLWQMLQTPTAMLMLLTTTILVGGGIVETNNMGQMVEALDFRPGTTSASLAFFSVAQSAGRVVTGALSESALNWPTKRFWIEKGIPRTFFLVAASITGFVAHLLLAGTTAKGVFVVGAALSGFAFGMVWPLLVLVVGEVFGTKNVGANYMFFVSIRLFDLFYNIYYPASPFSFY